MLKGTCSVCSNPRLREITSARDGGAGLRAVAGQFGISRATLARHERHSRPAPAELAMEVPAALPDHPAARSLAELADLHRKALDSYQKAVRDDDRRNVAALLLQLRRNLEVRARLEAALRPDDRPPTERLRDNPEWQAFKTVLFRVLPRFPEAREALRVALEETVAAGAV